MPTYTIWAAHPESPTRVDERESFDCANDVEAVLEANQRFQKHLFGDDIWHAIVVRRETRQWFRRASTYTEVSRITRKEQLS